jgi:hypothetical protein
MSVKMTAAANLVPLTPTPVLDNGKRFVMVKNPGGQPAAIPLTFVLNWTSELPAVK